jgi:hypothetical protein
MRTFVGLRLKAGKIDGFGELDMLLSAVIIM